MQDDTLFYHFTTKWKINYGKGVFLTGNISQLGCWDPSKALRMECFGEMNWLRTVEVPSHVSIQYKFFQSDFNLNEKQIEWENHENHKIKILPQKNPPLRFMSFNLRYENKRDVNEFSWHQRRENCVQMIKKNQPSFVGVQEAIRNQRQYLFENLKDTYEYLGKARDRANGEECGVFVNRDHFFIVDCGFEWISQSRKQGQVGYDAKLPRYFTYVVLLDKHAYTAKPELTLAINVHLDHEGKKARKHGILQMYEKCRTFDKYQIRNYLMMGDFNTQQTDQIFKPLFDGGMKFQSARLVAPKTNKSLTFNGFQNKYILKIGQWLVNEKLTIDHMFYYAKENYSLKLTEFQVLTLKDKIVSDHYPIMCTFSV